MHIVWPIEGSEHDKSIYDKNIDDLYEKVPLFHKPSKIIGDKGYQDENSQILITPIKGNYYTLSKEQIAFNEKLSKIRILIENYFGRFKCMQL